MIHKRLAHKIAHQDHGVPSRRSRSVVVHMPQLGYSYGTWVPPARQPPRQAPFCNCSKHRFQLRNTAGEQPGCTAPPPTDDPVIHAVQSELARLEIALCGNHRRAALPGGEIGVDYRGGGARGPARISAAERALDCELDEEEQEEAVAFELSEDDEPSSQTTPQPAAAAFAQPHAPAQPPPSQQPPPPPPHPPQHPPPPQPHPPQPQPQPHSQPHPPAPSCDARRIVVTPLPPRLPLVVSGSASRVQPLSSGRFQVPTPKPDAEGS